MYTTVKSLVSRKKIMKLFILFSKDALKYSKNTENVYVTKYLYFK